MEPVEVVDQDGEEMTSSRKIGEIMETEAENMDRKVVDVEETVITREEVRVYGMVIKDEEVQISTRRTIVLADTAECVGNLVTVTYSGVKSCQSIFQEEMRKALQRIFVKNV